jgi:polysaccharide export outer membrane protein
LPVDDQDVSQDYLIGPEDVVEVMVWKNADLSRVVNVRPDGKISLPLIGDIQAAGYTALQLKDEITEQLNVYYKETPQVSVIVQQVNSYAIYILGEVRRPGKYVVKTGTTFLQAISLAGGFTEFASTNRILLKRKVDEKNLESSMSVKYKAVISGVQRNIMLKSGDTIIIP